MSGVFTAIVPVKRWADAKSRLPLSEEIRSDLARAFAADVIAAVAGTSRVGRIVVVSSGAGVAELVRGTAVHLMADPEQVDGDRLNAAISAGAAWALREHPQDPVVVVPADLPSLTSAALGTLLAAVAGVDRAVVPDASGEGTALLVAGDPSRLSPRYGADSAARHAELGYVPMHDVDPGLRRDVDSLADLAEAVSLGVGPATAEVVRQHTLDLAG